MLHRGNLSKESIAHFTTRDLSLSSDIVSLIWLLPIKAFTPFPNLLYVILGGLSVAKMISRIRQSNAFCQSSITCNKLKDFINHTVAAVQQDKIQQWAQNLSITRQCNITPCHLLCSSSLLFKPTPYVSQISSKHCGRMPDVCLHEICDGTHADCRKKKKNAKGTQTSSQQMESY